MALLIVGTTITDGWWLGSLAVAAVAARIVHAVGILTSPTLADHGPLRDMGAATTYAVGVALALTALVGAVT